MADGLDGVHELSALAVETIDAFERISDGASKALGHRTPGIDAFANINELNAGRAIENLGRVQHELAAAYRKLRDEPAIARVVVADEDDNHEVLFIARATTVDCGVRLCSYLAPKGRLASLPVGGAAQIRMPSGPVWFEVLERATYRPVCSVGAWDSRDTVVHAETFGPLTIASLRALLEEAGGREDELAALDRLLDEEAGAANVQQGLKRSILTAMALRDQPLLDQFQDSIFRLPLDTQLVILGPPGTGKTTTLIRRLKQKIAVEFLEPDEKTLIGNDLTGSLTHAQSWLMFTPTELLKQYVREAFAREGVPAPDQRIRTWYDHRRELARNTLPILRSASGGTLVLNEKVDALQPSTVIDQPNWFDDFDAFQKAAFLGQLARDADTISGSSETPVSTLGRRLAELIGGAGDRAIPSTLFAISKFEKELKLLIANVRAATHDMLRRVLADQVSRDPSFLDELARFSATLSADAEDTDEVDADDEEEADVPRGGRAAAQAIFLKAMRAKAISDARKRSVGRKSRNGKVLNWLLQRGVDLPELQSVGKTLIVQQAARRFTRASSDFIRSVPTSYRAFRKERMSQGRWYLSDSLSASEVTPLEVDVVLLAMLRNARALLRDRTLMRHMGENLPPILETIRALYRNQVLVDEATDFSPVQLGCMAALAKPETESFFACGDFNQRLTRWGSRTGAHLNWVYPTFRIETITVAYRQSRCLNELARALVSEGGEEAVAMLPEHMDYEGVPPVMGKGLGTDPLLVEWLARRIFEIEDFTGRLPSIAILVNQKEHLEPLANSLDEFLSERNIRAVPCPGGQVMGRDNDVRLFEIEHIKGLEFEAVFFVDVDRLHDEQPELFDKYLYVGATRAATYLGVTCAGNQPPALLAKLEPMFSDRWPKD